MKIIDLLNKIANGEEVPKKIHIKQFQCDFIFNGYTYLSDEEKPQNIYWCLHSEALNYGVEILEEEKKIPEKLNIEDDGYTITLYGEKENEWTILDNVDVIVCNKINSIIDYLKSKGDE